MAFTYFFRDRQSIDYTIDHLIPFATENDKIKIWDAGCATGEEPYSFMILLAERLEKYLFERIEVHATDVDISNRFDQIINEGIYAHEKLKRIPAEFLEKYFMRINGNGHFQINEELRSKIIYKREDLRTYESTDHDFSLIICKNVLLHQTPEQRLKILEMFHESLLPGGMLIMEHTQKMLPEFGKKFEPVISNAQLYRKKLA